METVKKKTYENWYPLPQKILRSDYKVWTYKEIFHFISGLDPDECWEKYHSIRGLHWNDSPNELKWRFLENWERLIPEKNLLEIKQAIDFGFPIDSMKVFWLEEKRIKELHALMKMKSVPNPDPVVIAEFLGRYYFITNY